MKLLLATMTFLGLLLVSMPAWAFNSWTGCGGGAAQSARVGSGACKEFKFNNSLSPLSTTFTVSAKTAIVSFEQDLLAASGSATAMIQVCIAGYAASATTCADMLSANLDGTGGAPASQLRSLRVGPGLYRVTFVAASASDEAVLQVQGE